MTFDAPTGAIGTHIVTFTATDPEGNSRQGTYTVNVIETVEPKTPVVSGIPDVAFVQGSSNSSILLDNHVTDEDTPIDQMQWTFSGNTNVQVTIDPGTQRVTFTAAVNFVGVESITFAATDPAGLSDSQTISVTVTEEPIDKKPPVVVGIPDVTFAQESSDSSILLNLHVTDEDTSLGQIQWVVTGNTSIEVTIGPTTRRVTFTAAPDFVGTEAITFTAIDPDGLSGSQTISVTVQNIPPGKTPPVVAGIPDVTFTQGESDSSILLNDHVTDGDAPISQIHWTVSGDTRVQVTIDATTQRVTFTAPADSAGTEAITFTATDVDGFSDQQTINVLVESRGSAPVITGLPGVTFVGGVPDQIIDLDEFVVDPDDPIDQLRWIASVPLNMTVAIDPETDVVTIVPDEGFVGRESITFTVIDSQQNQAEGIVLVEVQVPIPSTKRPIVSFQPLQLEAGTVREISLDDFVTDEDTPDAEISWTATDNAKILITIVPVTHVVQLQLKEEAKDFLGPEIVTLTATDPEGNSDTGSFAVTVEKPKDRTPPSFQIFALPNPIQPDFLTITAVASETLIAEPTVLIRQQPVPVKETDVSTWTGTYTLPRSVSNTAVIIVRGSDLGGNNGQSTKTLRFNQLLAAPRKPLTFVRVSTHPNPATSHKITVECQIDSPTVLTVQVYDATGNPVKTMSDDEFQAVPDRLARSCQWNLTDDFETPLANGTYFCYAIARNGTATKTHCWKMAIAR